MILHVPVLVREVITLLDPKPNDVLLDATLGHGGHAKAFLDAAGNGSKVIGIDADSTALEVAKKSLASYGDRVTYIHGNFYELPKFRVQAILFDLGIGSHQIADDNRGFSFASTGELSMKYGEHATLPASSLAAINDLTKKLQRYPDAADIVNNLPAASLAELVRLYGEERYAYKVANAITQDRPFGNAHELSQAITRALPAFYEKGRIHAATRTFQALRLAVNRELEVLAHTLPLAGDLLVPGGKIAVISFHSLEDRIVKRYLKSEAQGCICPPSQIVCVCNHKPRLEILTRRPIVATSEEKATNSRSRSAKLRAALRLSAP